VSDEGRFAISPYLRWFILATILGVVSGVAAIAFYYTLELMQQIFMSGIAGAEFPRALGEGGILGVAPRIGNVLMFPLVVALGGALSGLLVYAFAPEAEGHGTDAVIKAYHWEHGKIRRRVIPIKFLASAITIGAGGSAGREGPTAQFAAGIGSFIADLFKLSPRERRIAVATTLGSAIGAIFRAPIGGALFSAEVLYRRDIEVEVLFPALIASAIAFVIFGSVVGFAPVFGSYGGFVELGALPLFIVLGFIDGAMAIIYVKVFYGVHDWFKRLRANNFVKPIIGGFITGILGILAPEVLGVGYGWANLVEFGRFEVLPSFAMPTLLLLAALPLLKILATAFTVGSGGSGGVFAPGIVTGAYVGAVVGMAFQQLFPNLVHDVAPFVIASMLALFGAAAKAPLSVMFMVIEMTGGYQMLPAAMIAIASAYLVSGDYSIYRAQVPTRRDSPAHMGEYEIPLLTRIKVGECKLVDIKAHDEEPVEEAVAKMRERGLSALPVVDGSDKFLGLIRLGHALGKGGRVKEFLVPNTPYVTLNSSLYDAWEVMGLTKSTWVPVVEDGKLIGVLTLDSILEAYRARMNVNR